MIENDFYKIDADPIKNRLFITLKGFWSERLMDNFKNYITDLENHGAKKLRKGFYGIVDYSTFKAPPASVGQLFVEAQKIMLKYGMAGTAQISKSFTTAKLATKRYSEESGLPRKDFTTKEDAIAWLDSVQ